MSKKDEVKEEALKDVKKVKEKGSKFFNEFKAFVLRGNVMDMAVGVIIGGAFTSIVSALTEDFINPLINCVGGTEVKGQIQIFSTGQYLNWGHFITAVINFIIMAAVLFCLLKGVNKIMKLGKKQEEAAAAAQPPKKSDEVLLLEEIRDLLKENKKNK